MIWLLLLLISSAHSLPSGAPPTACDTMMPFHGGGLPQQTSSSPFGVSVRRNGNGYMITVKSSTNVPFQGFMLQARDPSRNLIGTFEPTTDLFHTIDCQGAGDTLTHSNTQKKPAVEVQWNPNGYEGPITFNSTVAQDFRTFWAGIESQQIQISKDPNEQTSNFPPSTRPTTSTSPKPSTDLDPFYDNCSVKKTCFGAPAGCIASKNCKVVAAITVNDDRYEFELKAVAAAAWAGVGLSDDTTMGDDSVIECVKDDVTVNAYLSYTTRTPKMNVVRDKKQDGIQLLERSVKDGALYCKVLRETKTTVNGRNYDLAKDKYYLLIAAGSSVSANKVGFHDVDYLASGEKKFLSDVSAIKAASKLLLRLHGAFMLAAWLGTASIGTLLARYYKQTWVGSTLCGKDLWFAWHRLFMVLTWALTTAGFVLVFVELRAWSAESNPHAILGLITTIICFIQPIGAYFRPHPGTSKRPIFNWVHWLGGNVAHIIAIVTIFFAVKLHKADLPKWMNWILVAFVVFHVVVHLLLSIMGRASEKSAEKRVNASLMKDMSGSEKSSLQTDHSADAPYSTVRKCILALYIFVIILIVAALIVIAIFAPIEEFINNL